MVVALRYIMEDTQCNASLTNTRLLLGSLMASWIESCLIIFI